MYRGAPEYPRTTEFIKYAASTCGTPAELHGKPEAMRAGLEIMLGLPQPFTGSAFCNAKIPPIMVKITELARVGEENEDEADEEGEETHSTELVFAGRAVRSIHQAFKEGDEVIGLASEDGVLVVNAGDPESMGYLLETYHDEDCMQHVAL